MQFILKDGYIYLVKNEVPENNKIEGTVVIKYVNDYENKKFYYAVNGEKFKLIKNETITISEEHRAKPFIELVVKAVGKEEVDIFKTDKLPLTRMVILGEKVEDVYPKSILGLREAIENLDKKYENLLKRLEQRVTELEEVGDLI